MSSNHITNPINSRNWLIIQPMLRTWFQAQQQYENNQVEQVVHLPLELQQQRRQLNLHREHQPILDMQLEESISISYRQYLIRQLRLHLHETVEQQMQMIQMLCDQHEPMKERMDLLWINLDYANEIENQQINQQTNQILIYLRENVNHMIQMIQIMFDHHRLTENQLWQQMEEIILIENQQNEIQLISNLREIIEQKELIIQMLIKHHRLMENQMYEMWYQLNHQ